MNEVQIREEILRYLGDDNYRYAVLINGEWGCGKTWFVLNDLKRAMEEYEKSHKQRKIKYISLYGCKSVEEAEEAVCWSVIDEKFYAGYDKLIKSESFYGEKRKKKEYSGRVLYAATQKIIGTAMQRLQISYNLYEYLLDFVVLRDNIFVFDDLERCNCPINDILGYINSLVEHEGAKVVLVANENEIGSLSQAEYKELQYLVASSKDIKIPQEESLFGSLYKEKMPEPILEPKELERRRKALFAEDEYDGQYKRIKEKLIGATLCYEPDFAPIMHKLISHYKEENRERETEIKAVLNGKVQYFMDTMKANRHQNLRTFQFFLSKADHLYEQLQILDIEEKYRKQAFEFVVENCFLLCVEFKGNIQKPEDGFAKISYENTKRLQSIFDYVRFSKFDRDRYQRELEQYIKEELSGRLDPQDPYMLLFNQYYIKSQAWAEEKMQEILDKLQNHEYPIHVYRNILSLFVELKGLGFDRKFVDAAVSFMTANVQKESKPTRIYEECLRFEDAELARECRGLIKKINGEIREVNEAYQTETLQDIMQDSELWADKLREYVIKHDLRYESRVLSRISEEIWVSRILESDAEKINILRECLEYIFSDSVIKQDVQDDMQTIRKLLEQLHEDTGDLIKNTQIKWLKGQLRNIYKQYVREDAD